LKNYSAFKMHSNFYRPWSAYF